MNPYVHDLTIERRIFDDSLDARDDYGQPSQTTTSAEAKGLVQPRTVDEADDHRSAGAQFADHVVFLPLAVELEDASAIVWDGQRYEVVGLRPFRFGRLRHWEVDARLVREQAVTFTEEGS